MSGGAVRRSEKVEHCGVGAGFGLRAQGAGVVGATLLHRDRHEQGLRCVVRGRLELMQGCKVRPGGAACRCGR